MTGRTPGGGDLKRYHRAGSIAAVVRPSLYARLYPHWAGGRAGYVYSIIFGGELLISRSRDPEYDAARALAAKGITGRLTLLDGKTGRPRCTLDIEKAARFSVREDRRKGPMFVK